MFGNDPVGRIGGFHDLGVSEAGVFGIECSVLSVGAHPYFVAEVPGVAEDGADGRSRPHAVGCLTVLVAVRVVSAGGGDVVVGEMLSDCP